jgi:hypothetical protein
MKTLFITVSVILSALVFVGCAGRSSKEAGQYTCSMHPEVIQYHPGLCPICKMDLTKKESVSDDESNHSAMDMASKTSAMPPDTPLIKASFVKMDAKVNAHIKNVLGHYMHMKNALVESDMVEAKKGAAILIETIRQFDDSWFPAKQKIEYDKHKTAVKEQAQEIVSATALETQRGHFAGLSAHVYELLKTFSTGKKLYHNHCEMALDNNGAIWLSETNEIKNPYMGSKMLSCGSVEEILN